MTIIDVEYYDGHVGCFEISDNQEPVHHFEGEAYLTDRRGLWYRVLSHDAQENTARAAQVSDVEHAERIESSYWEAVNSSQPETRRHLFLDPLPHTPIEHPSEDQ
jgi:hypothetical protein